MALSMKSVCPFLQMPSLWSAHIDLGQTFNCLSWAHNCNAMSFLASTWIKRVRLLMNYQSTLLSCLGASKILLSPNRGHLHRNLLRSNVTS